MKKVILIIISLMLLMSTVSAYAIYLECPESVQIGLPLKCSIDSDFPPGTTFNIVLYQTQYTATQVKSETVTVQQNQQTQYRLLDTTGLPRGKYKVEVKFIGADEPRLRSDSKTLQLVNIIDRSEELTITSPMTQNVADALRIEGAVAKLGSGGVQLEVRDPDGAKIYGPLYIGTTSDIRNDDGKFTQKVPVTMPGNYEVAFSDAKGYISTVTFKVVSPTTATTAIPTATTVMSTTVKTPTPLTTVPTTTTTVIPTATTVISTTVKTPTPFTTVPTTATTITTVTSPATMQPTLTITTAPTKSIENLIEEQNKKIDAQNALIAEQNQKISEQNDILSQIIGYLKNIFGWK